MIESGVIRESDSPYSSPIITVRKNDWSNRLCTDFRKCNRATLFDSEAMVKPEDIFARNDTAFLKV